MPDLRLSERFTANMERVEMSYLKALGQALKETRLTLTETALSDPTALAIMARREFDALSQQVAQLAREFGGPTETAALDLVQQEFNLFNRVGAQTVDFSQAQASTSSERQNILSGFGQSMGGWLEMLQANFLTELQRLFQADEPAQTISDRLLAEQITTTGRASVWRTGINIATQQSQRGLWGMATAIGNIVRKSGESQAGQHWRKQVIAAIDERTTDCCLRVHGQIQLMDAPFKLAGTPRYADEMKAPPFHDYCRTVQALYVEEFEVIGVTTDDMRDAANAELAAREGEERAKAAVRELYKAGKISQAEYRSYIAGLQRPEIHPAHATSRRS